MKKRVVLYKVETRYMYHIEVTKEEFEIQGNPPFVETFEKVKKFS